MPLLIASEVMDLSAAALNDVDKTRYDYETQLPYLKMALQELQEIFELNSLPVTEFTSAIIQVNAGVRGLNFNAPSIPRLPDNLIEPQHLWLSNRGTNTFSLMGRRDYVPGNSGWGWQNDMISLGESNTNSDIKIEYIGSLFPKYLREDTILPVQNALGYLAYKTAELISDMIEHNQARAQSNGGRAMMSLDRITGITIKGKQQIMARRRPFRSSYKGG